MLKAQNHMREAARAAVRIPLDSILPNPRQPRRRLSEDSIRQLAESIRRHGQLSPLLVRPADRGTYELIAGQRRLLALRMLGRGFADVIVLTTDDCDCALIALVENLQREQLHFLDEAEAFRAILAEQPITQERLALSLSISPSALANRLRLLKLSARVRDAVREGALTERHARALLGLQTEREQLEMARMIADQKLSVKQAEARIARQHPSGRRQITPAVRDNRIIINAVMETVRQLQHIGIRLQSRVDECEDHIDVVVTIPIHAGS